MFKWLKNKFDDLVRENKNLHDKVNNLEEELARRNKERDFLHSELENIYVFLKTIQGISKDKTIETLIILKMLDIKNIPNVYISEE